jgi:hypothetical protein
MSQTGAATRRDPPRRTVVSQDSSSRIELSSRYRNASCGGGDEYFAMDGLEQAKGTDNPLWRDNERIHASMDRVTFTQRMHHTDQAGVRSHHPELASNGTTNPTNRNETIENKAIKRLKWIKLAAALAGVYLPFAKAEATYHDDLRSYKDDDDDDEKEKGAGDSNEQQEGSCRPCSRLCIYELLFKELALYLPKQCSDLSIGCKMIVETPITFRTTEASCRDSGSSVTPESDEKWIRIAVSPLSIIFCFALLAQLLFLSMQAFYFAGGNASLDINENQHTLRNRERLFVGIEYLAFYIYYFLSHAFLYWFVRSKNMLNSDKHFDREFLRWLGADARGFEGKFWHYAIWPAVAQTLLLTLTHAKHWYFFLFGVPVLSAPLTLVVIAIFMSTARYGSWLEHICSVHGRVLPSSGSKTAEVPRIIHHSYDEAKIDLYEMCYEHAPPKVKRLFHKHAPPKMKHLFQEIQAPDDKRKDIYALKIMPTMKLSSHGCLWKCVDYFAMNHFFQKIQALYLREGDEFAYVKKCPFSITYYTYSDGKSEEHHKRIWVYKLHNQLGSVMPQLNYLNIETRRSTT